MQSEKKRISKHPARSSPQGGARRRGKKGQRYSFQERLRIVKLLLEEGYPRQMIHEELGISTSCLGRWTKLYREYGEEGLKDRPHTGSGKKLAGPVREKILELKKKHPAKGSCSISQILRRIFFLKASPETVRKTLHEADLVKKPRIKPKRNPSKPRFFERATPNQLWQSDIFTFRLGGHNAYLIGYMDDYSRYLPGLGLFRSQTAEHVIEVYRTAISEYGVPKEMLTDNGRQYTNWRGTSRFEAELAREKVHHLKSRPHHPMTLGKIERFWKTIYGEFLCRARFSNLEEAKQRISLWVKYYNHKRPHQGIGGLCPADRYFEVQHELKRTIQKGIKENILEMALRGKPRAPFYITGRMNDQSVVIERVGDKLKMLIDGKEAQEVREIEYDIHKGGTDGEREKTEGEAQLFGPAKVPGGIVHMDGEEEAGGSEQRNGCQLDDSEELAGPGAEGDAAGTGIPYPSGERAGTAAAVTKDAGKAEENKGEYQSAGEETLGAPGADREVKEEPGRPEEIGVGDTHHGENGRQRACPEAGAGDYEGQERPDDGDRRRPGIGGEPQDVLRVGKAGSGGADGGAEERPFRPPVQAGQFAGSTIAREGEGAGRRAGIHPGDHEAERACAGPGGDRSPGAQGSDGG